MVVLRHPIANAYATRAWGEAHGGKASLGREAAADFVEHWLAAHAILDADLPHLRRVRVVHLEELSAAPQATFDAICGDLGLPSHALPAARVQSDVNRKYWHEYRKDAEDLRVRIAALAGAFAKFGYRLDDDGFGTVVAPYPAAEKAGLAPNGHAVDIGNGASNGCGTKRSAASASVPVPNGRAGKAAKVVGRAGTPLRPVIITFGTRGDVQPFIPLALEMQARGMKPVLVAHPVFRKLVEGAGVTFASLVADENAAPLADATECAAAGRSDPSNHPFVEILPGCPTCQSHLPPERVSPPACSTLAASLPSPARAYPAVTQPTPLPAHQRRRCYFLEGVASFYETHGKSMAECVSRLVESHRADCLVIGSLIFFLQAID